jgi:colanic acid biosynthesis glycosyl transferase WcaI
MRLGVVAPHFTPDVAPTGVVVTRIVLELAARGHQLDVLTSLPWYRNHRIEPGYEGRMVRTEDTPWGRITRIHPFPSENKQAIIRRALAFAGFSTLGAAVCVRGGRLDGVLAVSPPLTLGLTGWAVAKARRAPLVFNVQDVYPDVAIELGVLYQPSLIGAAKSLERICYRGADAITVLSEDLKNNVANKLGSRDPIHVIPNFVDTEQIQPMPKENAYRIEYGLTGKTVVMYAGNVGLSQALGTMLDAAGALAHEEDIVFVINGGGAKRSELERRAANMPNVRFVDMQPPDRLPEVLAAADMHLVTLRKGLARSSVPSKSYSIMAAARPLIASVDEGSEIARVATDSGGGLAVPPEDAEALTKAVMTLAGSPEELTRMGEAGRRFVQEWVSPAAVARSYEELFSSLKR